MELENALWQPSRKTNAANDSRDSGTAVETDDSLRRIVELGKLREKPLGFALRPCRTPKPQSFRRQVVAARHRHALSDAR